MKTIGLIGGMSWESSKVYYELLNTRTNELLGGSHSNNNIMVSVDFAEIERMTFAGDWDGIGRKMESAATQLKLAGADMILLCTNLIHIVSQHITDNVDLPFVHIAEATGEAIMKKGLKKVGLLGTSFTMEKEFYKGYIKEKYDVEVIIPEPEDREIIHNMIYNELVKGVFTEASKKRCLEVVERLKYAGAEGLIMGCTELPILVPSADIDIPSFDTSKIHVHKAIELAMAE